MEQDPEPAMDYSKEVDSEVHLEDELFCKMQSLRDFRFINLLESSVWTASGLQDVEFRVLGEDGELQGSLKAHKLLLSLLSPVFRGQFFGAQETNNIQDGLEKVTIRGPSFPAFQSLIQVLYSGDLEYIHGIQEDLDTVFQIYLLVEEYKLISFKKFLKSMVERIEAAPGEIINVLSKYDSDYILKELTEVLNNRILSTMDWSSQGDVLRYCSTHYPQDLQVENLLIKIFVAGNDRSTPHLGELNIGKENQDIAEESLDSMEEMRESIIRDVRKDIEVSEDEMMEQIEWSIEQSEEKLRKENKAGNKEVQEVFMKEIEKNCQEVEGKLMTVAKRNHALLTENIPRIVYLNIHKIRLDMINSMDLKITEVKELMMKELSKKVNMGACPNCNEVDCLKGRSLTSAWPGLRVVSTGYHYSMQYSLGIQSGVEGTVVEFHSTPVTKHTLQETDYKHVVLVVKWGNYQYYYSSLNKNIAYNCA